MTSDEKQIAEGLAAIAVTLFEMGKSSAEAEQDVVAWWVRVGAPSGAFSAAAQEISRAPQPVDESPTQAALRESLGGTTTFDQLNAALCGRELLESLAIREG
jgi:hypothetical protein